jgi:hypothetical protein
MKKYFLFFLLLPLSRNLVFSQNTVISRFFREYATDKRFKEYYINPKLINLVKKPKQP